MVTNSKTMLTINLTMVCLTNHSLTMVFTAKLSKWYNPPKKKKHTSYFTLQGFDTLFHGKTSQIVLKKDVFKVYYRF